MVSRRRQAGTDAQHHFPKLSLTVEDSFQLNSSFPGRQLHLLQQDVYSCQSVSREEQSAHHPQNDENLLSSPSKPRLNSFLRFGWPNMPVLVPSCAETLTTLQQRGQNHHMRARATRTSRTRKTIATTKPSD